jgi:magnesium-transporting ATPase (P-type)
MYEIFYLFNSRYLLSSVLSLRGLFGNRLIWAAVGLLVLAQSALTYWPPMQALFGTENIGVDVWWRILLTSSLLFVLIEIEKLIIRRIYPELAFANNAGQH